MYLGNLATAVALFLNTIPSNVDKIHHQPPHKQPPNYSMSDRTKENDLVEVDGDPNAVQESQIRKMTRLAIEFQAVNLSQGESSYLFLKEPGGELLISFKNGSCSYMRKDRCTSISAPYDFLTHCLPLRTKVFPTNRLRG